MYTLTSAVPGSSYTLTLRKGYAWGPGGVTSATAGRARHGHAQGRHQHDHRRERAAGRPGQHQRGRRPRHAAAGQPVLAVGVRAARRAVVQREGGPAHRRRRGPQGADPGGPAQPSSARCSPAAPASRPPAWSPPRSAPCKGNTVGSNLPAYDLAAAKSALAGKKLSPSPSTTRPASAPARARPPSCSSRPGRSSASRSRCTPSPTPSSTRRSSAGTAAWNVAIIPLGLTSPTQLVPFVSGATPPKGTDFAYINNAGYTAAVTKASATVGPGRLPGLERGGDRPVQERRPGAVRQLGGHQLRQGRDVPAQPGQHHAVLDPDARLGTRVEVPAQHDGDPQAAASRPAGAAGRASLPRASPWLRFAVRRLGQLLLSALVLVTAALPDHPPRPRRPGPGGARPQRARSSWSTRAARSSA